MSFMDILVTVGIFSILLLMLVFNKKAVEALVINFKCNFNMNVSDRYKLFIRYLYIATLTVLILFFTYGILFGTKGV